MFKFLKTKSESVTLRGGVSPINPMALSTLSGHTKSIHALIVLPNGGLASGSNDHLIKLWNVKSGACVSLSGHTEIDALTMLPNGRLASGSFDQSIKLWDLASGTCVSTLLGPAWVHALAPLANGRLASGYINSSIKLWDVERGVCVTTLLGHTAHVIALTVLPNGNLASGSMDKTIKIWDVESGACVSTLSGHTDAVNALTVLANGWLASGSHDKTITVWNVAGDRRESTLSGHTDSVRALIALPNGQLASGSDDKTIKVWDSVGGVCVLTLSGHTYAVRALAQLPNGQLASGSDDNTIKIWDLGLRPMLAPSQAEKVSRVVEPQARPKSDNAVQEKAPVSNAPTTSANDPFAEFDNLFATVSVSPKTTQASTDWTSDFATWAPTPPPVKAMTPSLSDMQISSNLTTIPWHALVIQRELGRGGFGVVYEALWQGTKVAIKQLLGKLTSDLMEEFQRETNVHARLRHPNIIALYGVCVEPMKYAMVMEFMANGSLYDVLKNPAELPWSVRFTMSLDLVSGLLYLHGQHIIHRDLKSLNILVDEHMRATVSDFGLAKIKLTSASMTKGGGGTPHWMAPELFDEAANSPATDVYATGVVLWEIAARKLPYEDKGSLQIMRFVEQGNRENIPAGTPPKFVALMTRCWAQRAEDRPAMSEVAREMREITGSTSGSQKVTAVLPTAFDSGYAAFSRR